MKMRHEVPRFGMVTNIHPRLLNWWEDLHSSDQTLVRKYLGNLPSLLEIQPDNKIIEVATLFWDSDRSVFRFDEGNAGGHLAQAYLLLGLRELVKLFEGDKDAKSGEGPSRTK